MFLCHYVRNTSAPPTLNHDRRFRKPLHTSQEDDTQQSDERQTMTVEQIQTLILPIEMIMDLTHESCWRQVLLSSHVLDKITSTLYDPVVQKMIPVLNIFALLKVTPDFVDKIWIKLLQVDGTPNQPRTRPRVGNVAGPSRASVAKTNNQASRA